MTAVLAAGIMEFSSDSSLQHAGVLKQEHVTARSCAAQASSWPKPDSTANTNKRGLPNAPNEQAQSDQNPYPLQKKIKTEPKDDYELAEEECTRKTSEPFRQDGESNTITEGWKYEHAQSASPVFDSVPSFAAEECHPFGDNCKQCVINEARQASDLENTSLHRRRQIREFEQGSEEPLGNKIREWTEKRLKSPVVRGLPRAGIRMEDEAFYQRPESGGGEHEMSLQPSYEHQLSRDDTREHRVISPREQHVISQREQRVITSEQHHVTSPREHVIPNEHHVVTSGHMEQQSSDSYIRYLLTHNGSGGPTIVSTEGSVDMQANPPHGSPGTQPMTIAQTSMPVVLTSPGVVPPDYMNSISGGFSSVSASHTQTSAGKSSAKVAKKRSRQQSTGSNFLERLKKGRHESPTLTSGNKNKANKSSENGADNGLYLDDLNRGQFGQGSTILASLEPTPRNQDTITGEQYISDIQRPYCNIPDDHQVTHINGVMSLPATRETRYGITLGELKRRTGYPEFLTRVDLIAYVRQSKSAGRALLDKYNISTAGQKSRPTILSKMCENEARVLGDGICRMNSEYFPWQTLAKVASNKVAVGKDNDGKVEQKLKAIQNTRTMLKEMYDLMVENKDITCMKTFEVASHTFGTANILNHLTIFDRLFAEYQNNLIKNTSENS